MGWGWEMNGLAKSESLQKTAEDNSICHKCEMKLYVQAKYSSKITKLKLTSSKCNLYKDEQHYLNQTSMQTYVDL